MRKAVRTIWHWHGCRSIVSGYCAAWGFISASAVLSSVLIGCQEDDSFMTGSGEAFQFAAGPAVQRFVGPTSGVMGVAYSPDGKLLAQGGMDKTVIIWDATDGKLILTLRGHEGTVFCVAFSRAVRSVGAVTISDVKQAWRSNFRYEAA